VSRTLEGSLARPVADTPIVQQQVSALETERNQCRATIDRQFTSRQARVTLMQLYSVVQTGGE
jgi:hypothetical protein